MATTEFKVFHGVGGVIARVSSHTKFSVLAIIDQRKNPALFSTPDRLFDVDLEATPGTVGLTDWSAVKFDDRGVNRFGAELPGQMNATAVALGITTLGTGAAGDLTRSGFVGAVYIEHQLFESLEPTAFALADNPHPWPGKFFELHQITSIAYSQSPGNGSRARHRYHGFQGRVTEVADGGKTIKVEFPGITPLRPLAHSWFRLDDPSECDSDPPPEALGGAQSLVADPTVDAQGALFVALPRAAGLALSGPKLPIGEGQ